jgi:hypothetical protein
LRNGRGQKPPADRYGRHRPELETHAQQLQLEPPDVLVGELRNPVAVGRPACVRPAQSAGRYPEYRRSNQTRCREADNAEGGQVRDRELDVGLGDRSDRHSVGPEELDRGTRGRGVDGVLQSRRDCRSRSGSGRGGKSHTTHQDRSSVIWGRFLMAHRGRRLVRRPRCAVSHGDANVVRSRPAGSPASARFARASPARDGRRRRSRGSGHVPGV